MVLNNRKVIKMDKIVALVLTYNRMQLLRECLENLVAQTAKCDILVVDNASTDDTSKMVKEFIGNNRSRANIKYINTGANLGGAGGFAFGMRKAVEMGYDYVWLMDDDTIPQKQALEKLVDAKNALSGKFGFLSSLVEWTDGSMCLMNKPLVSDKWWDKGNAIRDGYLAISKGSFVSFFVSADTIKQVGLPIKEFFIWFDDSEYSRRIIESGKTGYLVSESKVVHKMNNNNCVDIVSENGERLERYKYAFRNRYYLCKDHGIKAHIKYYVFLFTTIAKIILKSKDKKLKRIMIALTSTVSGWFFSPKIEYIDKRYRKSVK